MTRMDPVKIAGIKNWPIPAKVKDVRSFLGFCNFYRPFIRGFAHLACPLNELMRKDTEWSWETRHQNAFDKLKTRVTTEPVLAHPILTDLFELEVDASGFTMGTVLLQKKADEKAPYRILFQDAEPGRTKLRRIRLGTTSYRQRIRSLETIPSRIPTQNYHTLRSSKFTVLEGTTQDQ
jgi:hypothetical protein